MKSENYRAILTSLMKQKCERNPRFTQGAFAKQLGLSSSRLSEVLSGKQGLSVKWAVRIAEKLKFSNADKEHFCQLVQAEHSRSPLQKDRSKLELKKRKLKTEPALSEEVFKVIAEWQHLAILELYAQDSSLTASLIAKRLGIPKYEVQESTERLERIGQLRRVPSEGYKVAHDVTVTTQDIPSTSIRGFHRSMIAKAGNALEQSQPEEREITSVILSAKSSSLPELKTQLRELRDKFAAEVDKEDGKDSVYCLNINFFRLDNGKL
jgi:uncharacterized protein (TIGR02147 family)